MACELLTVCCCFLTPILIHRLNCIFLTFLCKQGCSAQFPSHLQDSRTRCAAANEDFSACSDQGMPLQSASVPHTNLFLLALFTAPPAFEEVFAALGHPTASKRLDAQIKGLPAGDGSRGRWPKKRGGSEDEVSVYQY